MRGRRPSRIARLALLAWLLPVSLPAEETGVAVPPNIEEFRLCRVALIFHLDTGYWETARYPEAVAKTLLDQMHFVMTEYVFGTLAPSVDASIARVRFAERFFFDTADIVRSRGEELRDLEAREAILDGCVPMIWETLRFEIDRLLRERRALIGLPDAAPHGGAD